MPQSKSLSNDALTVAHAAMATVASLLLCLRNKGSLSKSDVDVILLSARSVLESFENPRIKAGAEYLRQHPQLNDDSA